MKLTSLLALLVAFLPAMALADTDNSLVPHKAEYKVKISLVSGRLNTELRAVDEGFVARHVIKPTGLSKLITRGTMDLTSVFNGVCGGIRPVSFKSIDTIRKKPDVDLRFDWDTNQASGTIGDEDVMIQLEGISHDNVSLQYELMQDLINGNTSSQYTIFDADKMRIANVKKIGTKRIKTKAGTFDALGIQHQKEGSSRVTTFWTVEELGFLPVIMEQHRKGKLNFRATLVKYTSLAEPIKSTLTEY